LTGLEGFNNGGTSGSMDVQVNTASNINSNINGYASRIEINEDYGHIKRHITDVLVNISQNRLDALLQILEFATKVVTINKTRGSGGSNSRILGTGGNMNDANGSSTAATVSLNSILTSILPYLYKPYSTSHLSLKHKNQIIVIKPVISFLLEHYYDIILLNNNSHAANMMTDSSGTNSSVKGTNNVYASQTSKVVLRSLIPHNNSEGTLLKEISRTENGGHVTSSSSSSTTATHVQQAPSSPLLHSSKKPKIKQSISGNNLVGSVAHSTNTNTGVSMLRFDSPQNGEQTHIRENNMAIEDPATMLISDASNNLTNNVTEISHSSTIQAGFVGSWEWQVLESLMRNRVGSFIKGKGFDILSSSSSSSNRQTHSSTSSSHDNKNGNNSRSVSPASRFAWGGGGAGVEAARVHSGNTPPDEKATTVRNNKEKIRRNQKYNKNNASSIAVAAGSIPTPSYASEHRSANRIARHKAVSECRSLKQQIAAYEASQGNTSTSSNKRNTNKSQATVQRSSEMQAVFNRYKELKRSIRDNAATDIQRIIRGAIIRIKLTIFAKTIQVHSRTDSHSMVKNAGYSNNNGFNANNLGGYTHSAGNSTGSSMSNTPNTSNSDMLTSTMSVSQSGLSVTAMSMNSTSSLVMDDVLRASRDRGTHSSNNMNQLPATSSQIQSSQGVNVLSSVSFDAGLHMNQIANVASHHSATSNSLSTSSSAPSGTTSAPLEDTINHYKYLIQQKRDLKKFLKRFDEDFEAEHNRAPKKSDKEILRPQYQQYHDLKGDMTRLKNIIEREYGPNAVPTEDEVIVSAQNASSHAQKQVAPTKPARPNRADSVSPVTLPDTTEATSVDPAFSSSNSGDIHGSSSGTDGAAYPHVDITEMHTLTLSQLNDEKRNLHLYLKSYEKTFQKTHNRQVIKQEDIAPVANEYQRYKMVKELLAEKATTV
jgi:hypothetical protein